MGDLKWNNKVFDPNPKFANHMAHWGPWAEKFKDEPGDIGVLAQMLYHCCEETNRLNDRCGKLQSAYTALFFAFIETVDKLPHELESAVSVPSISKESTSISEAWTSVQQINAWRAKNKFNIKDWDVS